MADVLRPPMNLFTRIFGWLVLFKAVDLALRLPAAFEMPAVLLLCLGWIACASALILVRQVRLASAGLAVLVVLFTGWPELHNQHLWLVGWVALGLAVFSEPPLGWYLRAQLTVVYAFGAAAKLTPWFLSGDVLAATAGSRWMAPQTVWALLAVVTVAVEGWLAIGLWLTKTRKVTALIGVLFHVGVVVAMTAGVASFVRMVVFNGLVVALYLPFFWPRSSAEKAVPTAGSEEVRSSSESSQLEDGSSSRRNA